MTDIETIRHTLMTGLAHNAAIAALERLDAQLPTGGRMNPLARLIHWFRNPCKYCGCQVGCIREMKKGTR